MFARSMELGCPVEDESAGQDESITEALECCMTMKVLDQGGKAPQRGKYDMQLIDVLCNTR